MHAEFTGRSDLYCFNFLSQTYTMHGLIRMNRRIRISQIVLLKESRLESNGNQIVHLSEQSRRRVHVECGAEE
ncbi:hypothetical protein GCK72_003110 [Caenorhabditis remanei]|uniref:Uncharacterized protein n=1 Tax=Caenorhabditis remanei TaxID=31234 RepID=A0A6A5HWR3_CAERE|nr:hypothetical protein GCK72_003110 [Caenorhabditis remanei]KAF1771284.1 hypothetical protein GCK72_003110 [Caenorhabditis remanei]